jgi:hypothetical protein
MVCFESEWVVGDVVQRHDLGLPPLLGYYSAPRRYERKKEGTGPRRGTSSVYPIRVDNVPGGLRGVSSSVQQAMDTR